MTFGLLNINKPPGITSRGVVDAVQRLVRPAKVGHAGTLDPLAGGVLVVCLGPATRLIEYVQRMRKRYMATFRLGCSSSSDDIESEVVDLADVSEPGEEAIVRACRQFVGTIEQRPPAYSAVKVKGKRAYKLARSGEKFTLAARRVSVYRVELVRYDYPELELDIECGAGTYVRSLGRDLAESLGTGAVMSALVRLSVGHFHLDDASTMADLTADRWPQQLVSALQAVPGLPKIELNSEQSERVERGMDIDHSIVTHPGEVAAVDASGQLVAILVPRRGRLGPLKNLVCGGRA